MTVKKITYFDRPGRENTDTVVHAVNVRCQELGIRHVVVAIQGMDVTLISVSEHDEQLF